MMKTTLKDIFESFTSNVIDKTKSMTQEERRANVAQIQFEDPEVERICHEHGVYTYADAKAVTSIQGWFKKTSYQGYPIVSFNEFKYFTGMSMIHKDSFSFCRELVSIEIPDTVNKIGVLAFWACDKLKKLNIPSSVKIISRGSFGYCESLESIKLPHGLMKIPLNSFDNCSNLKFVEIPDTVVGIGVLAFNNCRSLQSINIPDSVTSIEKYAFAGCDSLQSINIPDSVTSIGGRAFTSLKSIVISKNCPVYGKIKEEYPNIQLVEPNVSESFTSNVIDKSKAKTKDDKRSDLFEYVNLGLPSGTLWKKYNVGATEGDIRGKLYSFEEAKKFNLPTYRQFVELHINCKSTWKEIDGVPGREFVSNINGHSIFFPANGYLTSYIKEPILNKDKEGTYYSKDMSAISYNSIYTLNFNARNVQISTTNNALYSVKEVKSSNTNESFTGNVINDAKNKKPSISDFVEITEDSVIRIYEEWCDTTSYKNPIHISVQDNYMKASPYTICYSDNSMKVSLEKKIARSFSRFITEITKDALFFKYNDAWGQEKLHCILFYDFTERHNIRSSKNLIGFYGDMALPSTIYYSRFVRTRDSENLIRDWYIPFLVKLLNEDPRKKAAKFRSYFLR